MNKYLGALVEYLDQGKLRPGLVVREQGERIALLEASGREKVISRELVLIRHQEGGVQPAEVAQALARLEAERARLSAELDLNLLWEVVRERGCGFSAGELAELFFGARSTVASAVVLEALLNDRLYFTRRHLEFLANKPEQVERLRTQQDKIRQRSESYRKSQNLIRQILLNGSIPSADQSASLIEELGRYLGNPSTRSKDLTTMLTQVAPDLTPLEAAFEILERLGAAPATPRFVLVGELPVEFGEEASAEAARSVAISRKLLEDGLAVTIDDEETLEVDDALSCAPSADGGLRVRVHIALVADLVAKGGALDQEAASRAATVYLPEATVRMLPDIISCDRASLIAGVERAVLTTEVELASSGEIRSWAIYPSCIKVSARLSYSQTDELIARGDESGDATAMMLARLNQMAVKLRERRRRAGAALFQRREAKVKVRDSQIEVEVIETRSASRLMVAEYMVLSNFIAARFAAENRVALIYRVQPGSGGDPSMQRPRLSLYPEFHSGIGLDYYAQLSSPIRRYADLVLQRQLIAALNHQGVAYRSDELLTVLANSENAESQGKELERRAKRYWILRYLQQANSGRPLRAVSMREGASAELLDYGIRGTLRGAPGISGEAQILVRVARLDPLRGWLALDYVGQAAAPGEIAAP